MINRIQCKCLLISSLSGLTRKRGMARASLAIPMRFLVAPDKLDIKRHKHGILYISVFESNAYLKFAKLQYVSFGFRCRVITGSLMRLY